MSHVAHYITKSELLIFCLYLKFWEAMFITGMFHCAWLVGLVVIIDSLEGSNVSHQVYLLSGGPACCSCFRVFSEDCCCGLFVWTGSHPKLTSSSLCSWGWLNLLCLPSAWNYEHASCAWTVVGIPMALGMVGTHSTNWTLSKSEDHTDKYS